MRRPLSTLIVTLGLLVLFAPFLRAADLRTDQLLIDNWRTTLAPADATGFEKPSFNDRAWSTVSVPHNHDTYHGYRQLRHGNLHGTAWYRTTFTVAPSEKGRHIFLFFEGVGSYATVWVNGQEVGRHAGGLTSFTLDVTDAVTLGRENSLAVRADHPAGIRDLPWLCGGCERTYGTSEGPQPLGIIRPVHVVTTAPVRIAPFGVHAWIDGPQSPSVTTRVDIELKNHGTTSAQLTLRNTLSDRDGKSVIETSTAHTLAAGQSAKAAQTLPAISSPRLWSPADPYLYTIVTEVLINQQPVDRVETPFGFRWISWPKTTNPDRRRLLVNGEPFFLNGTADYEHLLGNNFAFTDTQIAARVRQIQAAGFNAFRDAHHPHNLRFQQFWDRDGLLWWTQFGDTTWFDNEAFRANCKTLLREWVVERRNSPSLILWGLQNESLLPTAFAEECSALIRGLDPTASTQRLITTCNGGTGTDWDVPQNWSGTYSGDPERYDDDLRTSSLIGEYGAWRSLGLHTEGGFVEKSPLSEDRFCALMEMKIRLAEKARADACGHFQWPFVSHANPGRNFGENGEQLFDGIRPLDRVGPVNNKGLFTIWGEPTDAFYLYRANFAPKETQPMVYIVSHTWPDRWTTPGKKSGLIVYSNCDEVELFNGSRSLGRRTQAGRGTHFRWDDVEIDCNLLSAEARIAGKIVARDAFLLNHLPAPKKSPASTSATDPAAPIPGQHYLYRLNCGGPEYLDSFGNTWMADRDHPSRYFGISSVYGRKSDRWFRTSRRFCDQGKSNLPIQNTGNENLFRTYRFGQVGLGYVFALPKGDYTVELFFFEPWYGIGGGINCEGWRVFDVEMNGKTVIENIDIWKEAGHAHVLKKTIGIHVGNDLLEIRIPNVASGQAVISAIAISSSTDQPKPELLPGLIEKLEAPEGSKVRYMLDTGDQQYTDKVVTFSSIPDDLLNSEWISTASSAASRLDPQLIRFDLADSADVWVALDERIESPPSWISDWQPIPGKLVTTGSEKTLFTVYHKRFNRDSLVVLGPNGSGGAMYSVFTKKMEPLPDPQFVSVAAPSDMGWFAYGQAKPGVKIGFLGKSLSKFPGNFSDADIIVPTCESSYATPLTINAKDHVELVGAFLQNTAISGNWIDTKQTATASDGERFSLWRQRLTVDSTLQIPPGAQQPLFALVRAVRASMSYAPIRLTPDTTEWNVKVGVGDRYGLNFKYRNSSTAIVTATLEIVQADGTTLRTDPVEFPPTTTNSSEWSIVRTRTGASINAGTYKLRLCATPQLHLENLEVE